ncbi:hypothetical protein, variant 2 [Aphanomyces invadans]|uniref:Right handed beta helix domain-containing protein n=1 Tax=Aphanomyces invadans TaxID=157072 RepID=A0A024UUD8_9STRA|nr:hypothetical protein, variant 2 [Aphanomyces invadans]ETW09570.1 hypothetical protein, variant 2 [Aphanomyces invadans]|eukprot:XP_008860981.1 hypothetical protein, variant 2 [Aphanomyces invadans]
MLGVVHNMRQGDHLEHAQHRERVVDAVHAAAHVAPAASSNLCRQLEYACNGGSAVRAVPERHATTSSERSQCSLFEQRHDVDSAVRSSGQVDVDGAHLGVQRDNAVTKIEPLDQLGIGPSRPCPSRRRQHSPRDLPHEPDHHRLGRWRRYPQLHGNHLCRHDALGQMNGDEYFGGPAWASVNGFRVENVFEELDAPGEWYYDTTTSELYMIPPRGVIPTEATIEFPRLKQLVRVRGTPGIDVGYSEPSRDTMVTAAETETAHPASQALWASNLEFDGLEFTGTQRTDMELYETLPGHPWTQTRVGAIYIESAQDVRVEHCTFSKLGGNAIFVSGRTERIHVVLNHFTQIGATAVAIVAKSVAPHDPTHARQFLHSRRAIVSYNQMHDYGLVTRQSAAVLVVGTSQTTVYGNLVFAIPTGGVSYSNANANADGALSRLLVRPLDTPVQLVETLAPELGGLYTTRLNLGRLDRVAYPLQAKIIGGPECAPAQGRVGSLYGQQHAGCSDCCLTTHGTAGIRNSALGISAFTLQVPVEPTNVLDIQVQSAMYFDAPVDVHVGFHLVTPNRLVELPTWRVHWRVRTRFCVEQSSQQTVACAGPCGCHVAAGVVNMPPCPAGFDVQPTSLACLGPFQAWSTCETGTMARVLYYNCTQMCLRSVCV